ncbi:MAG: hypothetical protein WCP16_03510 [Pseudanabaena sp. ELA645]|jgi:hypothetical protein
MRSLSNSLKALSILGLGIVVFALPCIEAVNANPNSSRRIGGRNGADVSGNSSVNTNVQVDTTGRNNVRQSTESRIQGGGVQNSTSVQLNYSGCASQNSNQSVSQTRDGVGSGASASVSVCNPARR